MSNPGQNSMRRSQPDYPRALLATACRRPGLWLVPLVSAVLVAILAGLVGPKKWDATQSFVVREELIGRIVGPGRFESLDSMKTAQETIQEISRRPSVLRRVLNEVGPDDGQPSTEWPKWETIESLQDTITFFAPGGAELGKTEVLSMNVKSSSSERARQIVESLFEETRKEIRSIRQAKAQSMIDESGQSVHLAQERLNETTNRLRKIETSVGGDLSELRRLNEPMSGGSELSRTIVQLDTERRAAIRQKEVASQLIGYLNAAVDEPSQLLATPRELLESQPALSQLKNRLIEAQVNHSVIRGRYSARHPDYQASENSVTDIRLQIYRELQSSLVGLLSQEQLASRQIEMLQNRVAEIRSRISELASMRVDYGLLISEMDLRNQELTEAHQEFTQIESIHRAATSVDFISPVDEAQAGLRPLGPTRKTLVFGGLIAGTLIGFGFIMMVTPTSGLQPPPDDNSPDSRVPVPRPPVEPPQRPPSDPFSGGKVSTVEGTASPGFVIPDIGSSAPISGQSTVY